jgi:imidazolonepropionase-like amidohydrolase
MMLRNCLLYPLFGVGLFLCKAQAVAAIETSSLSLIHANLVPMATEMILPDQTVVVQGSQISAVGPSIQTKIPDKSKVIDCQGAYLMPGLSDMHMHLRHHWASGAWPISPMALYLANGVTTIRCFGPGGKSGRYALEWRSQIDAGRKVGPRILTCGPQLRGHFKINPGQLVIEQKKQGFDFLKIYSYVTREEYRTILTAAKKLNFYTAGHIPFQVGLETALSEGMDEIAHIEELLWEFSNFDRQRYFDSEGEWMAYAIRSTFDQLEPYLELNPQAKEHEIDALVAATMNKLKGEPVSICTTLVVDDTILQKLFDPDRFLNKQENRFLPEGYLDHFQRGLDKHQLQFKGGTVFARLKYLMDKKLAAALKEIRIPLLLSTDAGSGEMGIVPGFSIHDELRILVETGFTPYEALAAGTVVASRVVKRMNGRDDFGTIAPGKRADLILLKENPLEDVANARKISGVMAAGRWYDRSALKNMLNQGKRD